MKIDGKITDPNLRHDFLLFFDVQDGNPNGDPDAGNLPRVDPETMQGLVTDVCIKRKVRDYVDLRSGTEERFQIYIQNKGIALNDMNQRAYDNTGLAATGTKQKREDVNVVRKWMCDNFYDIRLFGAVMTMGVNCGQVRGPVQLTFARSIDQVVPMDISITRVAITRPEDAAVVVGESGDEKGKGKTTEMGRKAVVPYGLYMGRGFFSPAFAKDTGVTQEDLELFWESLINMWDMDHSAARGFMSIRGLYVFTHDNHLGNAPAHQLFDRVKASLTDDVKTAGRVARAFEDYDMNVNEQDMPDGVTLTRLVG